MSIKFPYGDAEELIILSTGGAVTKQINTNNTVITTQSLVDNVVLNLSIGSNVQAGAALFINCTTDTTETFEFGDGIEAPTITGIATKTWSQGFLYDGTSFNPIAEYTFTEEVCPTITIGDIYLPDGNFWKGEAGQAGCLISGGVGPYTAQIVAGTLPTGMSIGTQFFAGNYYVGFAETPTEFGSRDLRFTVTDNNGCVSEEKALTILVGARFTENNPISIGGSGGEMFVSVSGLPTPYGAGIYLDSVKINATKTGVGTSFANCAGTIYSPTAGSYSVFAFSNLSGTSLTNTVIKMGQSLITSGSSPYTGNFTGVDTNTFNTQFAGSDVNDLWSFVIAIDFPASSGGSIDSLTFNFLPL